MNSKVRKLKQTKYWEHVERPTNAPRGVRTVEVLNIASNKELGEVVVYRPLDASMFVYQQGLWDFRPLEEFQQRYRPVSEVDRQACDAIVAAIYY